MSGIQMKYFVLKPEGTDAYAAASRDAMLAYANTIANTNRDLSYDLLDWVRDIEERQKYEK